MKKYLLALMLLSCGHYGTANAQFYSVKSSPLHWLTGTINGGIEIAVDKQWSVEASVYWNPISTSRYQSKFWLVQPGVRYWVYEHFVGHFFGAHIALADYRIGNKKWFYGGKLSGIGISYGYVWMLSQCWNLTAEAGPGFYYLWDKKRDNRHDPYEPRKIKYYRRLVLAPGKLEVAFSYLF